MDLEPDLLSAYQQTLKYALTLKQLTTLIVNFVKTPFFRLSWCSVVRAYPTEFTFVGDDPNQKL